MKKNDIFIGCVWLYYSKLADRWIARCTRTGFSCSAKTPMIAYVDMVDFFGGGEL